jgi:hypothetical protein
MFEAIPEVPGYIVTTTFGVVMPTYETVVERHLDGVMMFVLSRRYVIESCPIHINQLMF